MPPNSRRGPGQVDDEAVLFGVALVLLVTAVAVVTVAIHLALALDGGREHVPGNPFLLVVDLVKGNVAWPADATAVAIGLAVAALVLIALVGFTVRGVLRRRAEVDRAARQMGHGRQLDGLTHRGARAKAERLGVDSPGVPLGVTVAGGRELYASWEDQIVDISGPRTGKTTSGAVPAVMAAPGFCLVTSNKRDIVDATRAPREARGDVWVFDPQGLVGEPCTWWWNPLSYVTDEVKAAELTDIIATASRDGDARTDAFFEPAGQDLVSGMLLAAARAGRPLTQVYMWLTNPLDDEPAVILRNSDPLVAAGLQEVMNAPERQRAGVYGTGKQLVSFMTNKQAMKWVTPSGGRELNPHELVRGSHTLYSLSREGVRTAEALVTALAVAVTQAAEELGAASPGGRLAVPMLGVLDEAANVCRWRQLPKVYSHYGSRGIVLATYLQGWSQGVSAWGREGMRQLWSSANVKVYGGGASEVEFLEDLSRLVGDHDVATRTVSQGRGMRTVNHAMQRQRILEVADLSALPRGRAVVFASGAPAALIRRVPWMQRPYADAVQASLARFDVAATPSPVLSPAMPNPWVTP